jgi:hypothetical protein
MAPGGGASYGGGGNAVLQYAIAQLGKPYRLGGGDDSAFDCSELTMKALRAAGINVTHGASEQQQEGGYEVGLSGAQPGDLVFFRTNGSNARGPLTIGHVGIYVGNGMVLEAPRTGDVVRIRPIGNRAGNVVSVKRYTTPSTAPIIVPASPWNGMHGGPGGGSPYIIPAGSGYAGAGMFGNNEVAPNRPTVNPYYPSGQAPTGAQLRPERGAQLNANQVAQVAYAAGFRGEDLVIAVAVAMGESGGSASALNAKGEHSVGLWQINRDAHGDRFGDDAALHDPYVNAQAAFALYQERGFRPWTVYTRGIYKGHLDTARAAVNQSMADGSIAMPYSNPGGSLPVSNYDPWSGMPTGLSPDPTIMAQQLLGSWASYLNHPDIGSIIKEAAAEGWDPTLLEATLQQTEWWQTTSAAKRTWDAAVGQDPATAQAQVDARMAEITNLSQEMGLDLGAIERAGAGNMVMHLATQSLMYGWSTAQLQDAIGAEVLRDPILGQQVREGTVGQEIRAAASDYGVPLSDGVLDERARQIAAGTSTMDDYKTYLIKQAKATYGELDGALDRGETVRQVADPYLQIASQMLGLDPSQLQLNDPKWMAALAYKDPATGKSRTLNFDEWQQRIRSDATYGYGKTDMAKDKAREFAMMLGQELGKVA